MKWLASKFIELYAYDTSVTYCFPENDEKAIRAICVEDVQDLEMAVRKEEDESDLPELRTLLWVTPPSERSRVENNYIVYGNEAEVGTDYADLNMVFTIPPANERGNLIL